MDLPPENCLAMKFATAKLDRSQEEREANPIQDFRDLLAVVEKSAADGCDICIEALPVVRDIVAIEEMLAR